MADLPPLHALPASTTATGAPVVDVLADDARDAIFQMLTDDAEPSKICELWSIWCDVKSGDAMCADTDEGRNHEMWKRGCDALGNGHATIEDLNAKENQKMWIPLLEVAMARWPDKLYDEPWKHVPVNGVRWTWRSYFNAICDALYEHKRQPGGAFGWYMAWLAELKLLRSAPASHASSWFYRTGGELLSCIRSRSKGFALLSVLSCYAIFGRYLEVSSDVKRRDLDYVLWETAHHTTTRTLLGDGVELEGANPQVAWLLAIYQPLPYDKLFLLVERLLNHSAIHPDMTDFTVEHHPSYAQLEYQLTKSVKDGQTMLHKVVLEHMNYYLNLRENPLFLWQRAKLLGTARALLNSGANPNLVLRKLLQQGRGRHTWYVWKPYLSVSEGEMTDLLLEYGARVDARHEGDTLVRMAIKDQNKERLRKLVQHGAEIHRRDFVSALKLKDTFILHTLMEVGGSGKAGGEEGRLWKMAKKAMEVARLQSELYGMMLEEGNGLADARDDLKELLPAEEGEEP